MSDQPDLHVATAGRQRADRPGADEPWSCRHIKLSNPAGPGSRDVPRLLRAVAELLERIGDDIEVLDLVLHEDQTPDGPWTAMNVFYRRGPARPARPSFDS